MFSLISSFFIAVGPFAFAQAENLESLKKLSVPAVCAGMLMYLGGSALTYSRPDYQVLQRQLIDGYRQGDQTQVQRLELELKKRDNQIDIGLYLERTGAVIFLGGGLMQYFLSRKNSMKRCGQPICSPNK